MYDPDGRYGRWNVPALSCYALGVLAQVPFLATKLYTGPLTSLLGGADVSWIVGLAVTSAVYYPWARRTTTVDGAAHDTDPGAARELLPDAPQPTK
ncbi:hypothetical protein ACGFLS_05490 [Streptomyces abikoensis]|uniref:hypothetical protein n=1 Tax=Streptomyces abikoensis TaxID=97398 RepID=UPI00371EBF5B